MILKDDGHGRLPWCISLARLRHGGFEEDVVNWYVRLHQEIHLSGVLAGKPMSVIEIHWWTLADKAGETLEV